MCGRILLAAVVIGLNPVLAVAQEWTPAQQAIITLTRVCWAAWAAEDEAAVVRDCPDHPRAAGWATSEDVPNIGWSTQNVRRWMGAFFPRTEPVFWEIRPLVVEIFDNTALYHFWAMWTEEDANGQVSTWTRKQMDVWQQTDGRWYWIGGMQAQNNN